MNIQSDNVNRSLLHDEIGKPAEDSKKWKMTMVGVKGICGIYLISTILTFLKPELAPQFASMMQITMYSFGGIISIFLGAQGSVDFRNSATLAKIDENDVRKQELNQKIDKTENISVKEEKLYKLDKIDSKDLDDLDGLEYGGADIHEENF